MEAAAGGGSGEMLAFPVAAGEGISRVVGIVASHTARRKLKSVATNRGNTFGQSSGAELRKPPILRGAL